nr:hypothetical protein [Pyrinomonadaceae bacterium]
HYNMGGFEHMFARRYLGSACGFGGDERCPTDDADDKNKYLEYLGHHYYRTTETPADLDEDFAELITDYRPNNDYEEDEEDEDEEYAA